MSSRIQSTYFCRARVFCLIKDTLKTRRTCKIRWLRRKILPLNLSGSFSQLTYARNLPTKNEISLPEGAVRKQNRKNFLFENIITTSLIVSSKLWKIMHCLSLLVLIHVKNHKKLNYSLEELFPDSVIICPIKFVYHSFRYSE